ncbi:MAG: YMGG-like glycine zipper-containing protein [Deltaproteobacteria bacterium]
MKKFVSIAMILSIGIALASCASSGYNTQKGAAIGAGLGAIGGQIIGGNTASTLIGTAVGALAGMIGGNALDQHVNNVRAVPAQQQVAYASADMVTQAPLQPPPGQWVNIPGQWVGGKWVPSHKVWMPVNP